MFSLMFMILVRVRALLSGLNSNDFTKYNSVIGPLMANNVVAVAKELRNDDIPVISPLTNTNIRLYKNLFQARPDEEFLMNRLKNYLVQFAQGKNVIIVTDNKKPEYKAMFAPLFPDANILYPNDQNYISSYKYTSALSKDQDNVVILAVDHVGFITDAVSNYAAKARTYKITMVGMDDYDDMNINNLGLAAVNDYCGINVQYFITTSRCHIGMDVAHVEPTVMAYIVMADCDG